MQDESTQAGHYEGSSTGVRMGSCSLTLSGGRDAQSKLLPETGTIDGQEADAAEVLKLLEWAKVEGHVKEVNDDRRPLTIGKAAARQLHLELGRLQFREHYALASEVLGVEVTSLAALTAEDAALVRDYAYGQWGLVAGEVAA